MLFQLAQTLKKNYKNSICLSWEWGKKIAESLIKGYNREDI